MRVYLAAPYAAREQVAGFRDDLQRIGIKCTSSWLEEKHEINSGTVGAAADLADSQVASHAAQDFRDVEGSDVLVLIAASVAETGGSTSTSGGRHVETGMALGLGKPVIVVGEPENVFHRWGGRCTLVGTWADAVEVLSQGVTP